MALAGIAAVASYAQAVSGFGFALLAVPFAMPLVGVQQAVVAVTLLGFILTFAASLKLRTQVSWKPVALISVSAIVGMPIGLLIMQWADSRYLSLGIGLVVLATVVVLASGGLGQLGSRGGVIGAGVVSGVLLSSTGMNGPPLVLAFQSMKMSPQNFRASLQVTFSLADFFVLIGFLIVGTLTAPLALQTLAATPAMALGWWLGDRTFARLKPGTFRVVVLVMLGVSGCTAVMQAVDGLIG
nr:MULTISPECIES: sulfite exporter TauE/SafE family protein [unclassified Leucobacter]